MPSITDEAFTAYDVEYAGYPLAAKPYQLHADSIAELPDDGIVDEVVIDRAITYRRPQLTTREVVAVVAAATRLDRSLDDVADMLGCTPDGVSAIIRRHRLTDTPAQPTAAERRATERREQRAQRRAAIIDTVRAGATYTAAAAQLHVSKSTVRDTCKAAGITPPTRPRPSHEDALARRRARRAANRDHVNAVHNAWTAANRDRDNARKREHRHRKATA